MQNMKSWFEVFRFIFLAGNFKLRLKYESRIGNNEFLLACVVMGLTLKHE